MSFKSNECLEYLRYDVATKEHKRQYKIIDSDFEEVLCRVLDHFEVGACNRSIREEKSQCCSKSNANCYSI